MTILTFDIEDWFHTHENRKYYSGHIWEQLPSKVVENTNRILEFLDIHDRKATFFILGWVADRHPELVKLIYKKGHEIGAHSYWHHNARLLSTKDFEKDLIRSLSSIENIVGDKVTMYRAPGYSMKLGNSNLFDILSENGITIDSSVQLYGIKYNGPFNIGTNTSRNIIEFPLIKNQYGIPYSGGGYFRVLPLRLIQRYFKDRNYNLIYLHPRDIDYDNPSSNLFSAFRNWFNRLNAGDTLGKLELLFENSGTMTLGEAAIRFNGK